MEIHPFTIQVPQAVIARRRAEERLLPRRQAAPVVAAADLPAAIPARRHEDQGTAADGLPLVYAPDRQV